MQRFIAEENIKRFREQLASCSDERQRETLRQLLVAEEATLNELERARRRSGDKEGPPGILRI